MFLRRLSLWAAALALLGGLALNARAADLAAAEKFIPQDSMLVFSIPDLPAAYGIFKQTPMYPAIQAFMELEKVKSNPDFQQFLLDRKTAEAELGIPLDVESLCGSLIRGATVAVNMQQENPDEAELAIAVVFKDAATAEKILAQFEKEAKKNAEEKPAEAGAATPQPQAAAQAVTRQKIAGTDVLVIPADGLWACAKGETLLIASNAGRMEKALNAGASAPITRKPVIGKAIEALNPTGPTHWFVYANYSAFLEAAAKSDPQAAATLDQMKGMIGGLEMVAIGQLAVDHLSTQIYAPNPGSDPYLAQMAKLYPPADYKIRAFTPDSALVGFSSNQFDGASAFDKLMETLMKLSGAAAGAGQDAEAARQMMRQQLDQSLKQFETMMGFSLRDDLFAAIGPELAATFDTFQFNMLGGGAPVVELTIACQIRDRAKLDKVLAGLEKTLTEQLPLLLAGGMQQQPGMAPPAVTLKPFAEGSAAGKVLEMPQLMGYTPGWVLAGNYVIFGSTRESLARAARSFEGGAAAYTASPKYAKARAYLPAKMHSEAVVNVRSTLDIVGNFAMLMGGPGFQGENAIVFQSALNIFKTMDKAYATKVIRENGDSTSAFVIMF